jgi:hypothetical protein
LAASLSAFALKLLRPTNFSLSFFLRKQDNKLKFVEHFKPTEVEPFGN